MSDFRAGDALLALRRQLAWEGLPQASSNFHATEELQSVRDRVFEELAKWELDIDATVIEKGKLGQDLKSDEIALYRWACGSTSNASLSAWPATATNSS